MDFDHHEETYIVDPVDTSSKNLPSILKDGYDNDNSSCSSMDTSSNIIAKIKALPGVKKDQIKDMINLASTVSEHSQPRRRRPRIRKRDPSQVPRPMNCFLTYRLEKQKQIATICPGANHREISKIVAKWWSQESDEEKKKYRVVAEKDKQLHREKYPNYKYSPKKKRQGGSTNNNSNESTSNDDSSIKQTPSPSSSNNNVGQLTMSIGSFLANKQQDQVSTYLNNWPFSGDKSLFPTSYPYGFSNKANDPIILPPPITHPTTTPSTTNYSNFNSMQNTNNINAYNNFSGSAPAFDYSFSMNMADTTGQFWTTPQPAIHAPVLPPIQQQQQQQQQRELPWITHGIPPSFSFNTPSTTNLSPIFDSFPSPFDSKQQLQRQQQQSYHPSTSLSNYSNTTTLEPPKDMFQNQQQLLPSYYPTLPTLEEPIYNSQHVGLTDMLNTDFPLMSPLFSLMQQTIAPGQTLLHSLTNNNSNSNNNLL